ncbi:Uncharacterized protein Adt_31551 [Abeliophyllum distichum]|uniref:Uncharacterized protein n=1 Tax=Abeliophyllum distichum TaxID=126358 RepID=A0ABD1REE9_9LAMI
MEEASLAVHTFIEFPEVDKRSSYHGVLGKPVLKELQVVTSINHLCLKFFTERIIATIKGNQSNAKKCYKNALQKAKKWEVNITLWDVEIEDVPEEAKRNTPQRKASLFHQATKNVMIEKAIIHKDSNHRITKSNS